MFVVVAAVVITIIITIIIITEIRCYVFPHCCERFVIFRVERMSFDLCNGSSQVNFSPFISSLVWQVDGSARSSPAAEERRAVTLVSQPCCHHAIHHPRGCAGGSISQRKAAGGREWREGWAGVVGRGACKGRERGREAGRQHGD